MRLSRSFLLFGFLVSLALIALASPVSEDTGTRFQRRDGNTRWLFPRKGGGGGVKGGGSTGGETTGAKPGSSTGNSGGRTSTGSGTPRGSNGHYGGGAAVPYRSGLVSPLGLSPFFIAPFIFWMPFYWGPYGAYYYRVNNTAPALPNNTDHNTTDPILCVCQNYQPCGCDDADGSYALPPDAKYAVINGTEYAVVNGTLDNGTTAPGADSAGMGMVFYLTQSGTWASWTVFVVAAVLGIQAL